MVSLFIVVIVVAFFFMVIMRLVGVIIIIFFVIVIISMLIFFMIVMGLEQRTLTELQFDCAVRFKQFSHIGIRGQCFNCICQPWRQTGPNPKYKIGILQRGGLRRAKAVFMRACTGLNNQIGCANTLHDPSN